MRTRPRHLLALIAVDTPLTVRTALVRFIVAVYRFTLVLVRWCFNRLCHSLLRWFASGALAFNRLLLRCDCPTFSRWFMSCVRWLLWHEWKRQPRTLWQ